MLFHGPESMFSDDYTDGYETVLEICVHCQGNRNTCVHIDRSGFGSLPTQEITNEEITDMTEEAIEIEEGTPEFIDPCKEITTPMARNPLGEYEENPNWDEITLVEQVHQPYISNDNDESEAA